jgi:hypothetical protein
VDFVMPAYDYLYYFCLSQAEKRTYKKRADRNLPFNGKEKKGIFLPRISFLWIKIYTLLHKIIIFIIICYLSQRTTLQDHYFFTLHIEALIYLHCAAEVFRHLVLKFDIFIGDKNK